MNNVNREDGCVNTIADDVPRVPEAWSDGNLTNDTFERKFFSRLQCRVCGGLLFEVLKTDSYETTARCPCGMYYVVHSG